MKKERTHNAMTPARARTQAFRYGIQRSDYLDYGQSFFFTLVHRANKLMLVCENGKSFTRETWRLFRSLGGLSLERGTARRLPLDHRDSHISHLVAFHKYMYTHTHEGY